MQFLTTTSEGYISLFFTLALMLVLLYFMIYRPQKKQEKKDAAIETHKKYIDIQMPLLGVEKIGWKPGCELQEESTPYNEQKDIAFYIDRPTAYTKIYPGQFAIYFPEDGHAPGIGQGNIRKVIVKVQVEE